MVFPRLFIARKYRVSPEITTTRNISCGTTVQRKLKVKHTMTSQSNTSEKSAINEYLNVGGGSFTVGVPSTHRPPSYRGFLCDMDGVLHRNGIAIEGAAEFLTRMRSTKAPFLLLTNEDRYTNDALSRRLQEILGVDSSIAPQPNEIYSSSNSCRDFFLRLLRHGFDDCVYVHGEQGQQKLLFLSFAHTGVLAIDSKIRTGLKQNVQDAFKNAKKGAVYTGLDPIPSATNVAYVVIGCQFEGS
jgi:hypothetical protein